MANDLVASAVFDSAQLGEQTFDLWNQTQGQFFELAPAAGHRNFSARIAVWNLNGLLLTQGGYSAQRCTRDARRVRSDGFDHYTFLLQQQGQWRADAGGRYAESGHGRVCVIDFARPIATEVSDNESLSFTIPRAWLDDVLPPFDMHGLSLDGARGGLLGDFLQSLPRRVDALKAAEAPFVAEACRHMLAACLAPSRDAVARAQPQIEGVLLRRASREIDAHLHDPEWGIGQLGAALRVSRSTRYRLFAPFGGVAEYVKSRRLNRAHRLLTAHEGRRRVATIAADCGFQSDSTFSRSFRQAFGYSPREAMDAVAMGMPRRNVGAAADEGVFVDWIRGLR